MLIEGFQRPMEVFNPSSCPFCDELGHNIASLKAMTYCRHVSRHLQTLSLKAPPFFVEGLGTRQDESNSADKSSHSDSSHLDSSHPAMEISKDQQEPSLPSQSSKDGSEPPSAIQFEAQDPRWSQSLNSTPWICPSLRQPFTLCGVTSSLPWTTRWRSRPESSSTFCKVQ